MELSAIITGERIRKPNGWGVWETDIGTVKGVIPWPVQTGEQVRLQGEWETSRFTGRPEFSFRSSRAHIDTEPRALLHYACTITNGLGPSREEEIWLLYGDQWEAATTLSGLHGLTRSVVPEWQLTLSRVRIERARFEAVAWLIAHGCTDNLACAAFARWEELTVPTVQSDPYRLAELPRYGFVHIDQNVAPHFGITRDDPRRHRAALRYELAQRIESTGDSCPYLSFVRQACIEWMTHAQFDAALEAESEAGTVERVGDEHISTPSLHAAESVIWQYLSEEVVA